MGLPSNDDATKRANDLLVKYDGYFCVLAHSLLPADRGQLEGEELIQRSRIKFWNAERKKHITSPRSYIKRIVNSVFVDMLREYKPVYSLPTTDDGELENGLLLIRCSEGIGDPQDELERKEAFVERLHMLSYSIAQLPLQQRRAILLRLKNRVDNLSLFMLCLRTYNVHIEDEHWPIEKAGKQRLASSVAPALTKIDAFFKKMNAR